MAGPQKGANTPNKKASDGGGYDERKGKKVRGS